MTNSQGRDVIIQGRIVWTAGDLFKGKPEFIFGTKTPKLDKTGKQMTMFGFGLAVPKTINGQPNPELQNMMAAMQSEALQVYQNGNVPPSFAWKYKDGDGIDDKGIPFSQRDGYKDCIVFNLTSYQAIRWFKWENGSNVQIDTGVKCGDYVKVQIHAKAHGPVGQGKPGMYLNPNLVQLVGYGTEIISKTVDADSVFGNSAPVAPQGAMAQPPAPPFPVQQQVQQQPYPGVLPQHMQQQVQQPQQPQAPAGFPFPFKQ